MRIFGAAILGLHVESRAPVGYVMIKTDNHD